MATKLLFLLLSIFSLLAATTTVVSARPGRTIFISTYSSYTFSLLPTNPNFPNPNPNPNFVIMDLRRPRRFFLLPLRRRFPVTTSSADDDFPSLRLGFKDRIATADARRQSEMTDLPLRLTTVVDRSKDILSVVASLLFGAACGALTAGTMYLVWSIVNFRHGGSSGDGDYSSVDGFSSDEDDDDDDLFYPKKKKKSEYVVVADVAAVEKVKNVDETAATAA